MDCERLEAEVEKLTEEIKMIRINLTAPIAHKQREEQLKQWSDKWSNEQRGGSNYCPEYHIKFLKKLKQELMLEKDYLNSELQQSRKNKFSPKMVANKPLWKDELKWDELFSNNRQSRSSESDHEYNWDEETVPLHHDRTNLKRLQYGGPQSSPEQNSGSNPTMFKRLMNTFRTKAKSMFGKGGKRKKTRRKSKK